MALPLLACGFWAAGLVALAFAAADLAEPALAAALVAGLCRFGVAWIRRGAEFDGNSGWNSHA